MDIKKALKYHGTTALVFSVLSAVLMSKYGPRDKVVTVEKVVPVEDESANLRIQELQNEIQQQRALMDEDQKTLQGLLKKHRIHGSENDIRRIKEAAKWLGIAMYRECRGCNKVETLLIGHALLLHLSERKLGNTMEDVVRYKTPGGSYFLEFASNPALLYVDSNYKKEYYDMAFSLISQSPDTAGIRDKYNSLFIDLGIKNVNGVYWCNQTTSKCLFHNQRVAQGCFTSVPKVYLRDGYRVQINPSTDISQHTVFINNGKCKL